MAKFSIPDVPEKETTKGILIKLPMSLYNRLRVSCETNNITMQFVVEQMIDHCLKEIADSDDS